MEGCAWYCRSWEIEKRFEEKEEQFGVRQRWRGLSGGCVKEGDEVGLSYSWMMGKIVRLPNWPSCSLEFCGVVGNHVKLLRDPRRDRNIGMFREGFSGFAG